MYGVGYVVYGDSEHKQYGCGRNDNISRAKTQKKKQLGRKTDDINDYDSNKKIWINKLKIMCKNINYTIEILAKTG